ncbi:MAG: lipoate---protein ligase [Verrucomicrobiota bacterium]|nr:lipoate---protein ligase [Verrucomicrobiota bacterium]
MLVVSTAKGDVYRNLALEEWLLDHAGNHTSILFLYVDSPCVVIGKNQNPWRECRLSLMEKERVPLARRISGGGAVYHDEGNLNIGVIVPRTQYREEKQYELIFRTLEKFGIQGSRVRKNSLAVNGNKFSGQAFCFRRQHVLHHGTLLVSSDLNRLGRYLGPEFDTIETKAIASVPAQVMNLADTAPGLTIDTLSAALIETFREMYDDDEGVEHWDDNSIPEGALFPIIGKISSRDWKLDRTPRFRVTISGRALQVENGRITNLEGVPCFSEWLKADQT